MINKVEKWIEDNNAYYANQRVSCALFGDSFNGFFSSEYLSNTYFVPVTKTPKPDFPELRNIGLGDFIDMPVDGITYNNTYYILTEASQDKRLHFHELVHVVQWSLLGVHNFIKRYIYEIQTYGYSDSPLEMMAYTLDSYFSESNPPIDVIQYVKDNI